MEEIFTIWIDRLREGRVQKIDESLDPSFLDVHEEELVFQSPVIVYGEAYLADDHLIVRVKAFTKVKIPCVICNQLVDAPLQVNGFYHTEPIAELRDAKFDFSTPLRDSLLLELPAYIECCEGKCPERQALAPYLRKQSPPDDKSFPFANLQK